MANTIGMFNKKFNKNEYEQILSQANMNSVANAAKNSTKSNVKNGAVETKKTAKINSETSSVNQANIQNVLRKNGLIK